MSKVVDISIPVLPFSSLTQHGENSGVLAKSKTKVTISLRLALAVFTIVLVIASAVPPSAILLTSSTKSLNIAKDTLLDTLQYHIATNLQGILEQSFSLVEGDCEYVHMLPIAVSSWEELWKLFYVQVKWLPVGSFVFCTLDYSFVTSVSSVIAYGGETSNSSFYVTFIDPALFNDSNVHRYSLGDSVVDLPDVELGSTPNSYSLDGQFLANTLFTNILRVSPPTTFVAYSPDGSFLAMLIIWVAKATRYAGYLKCKNTSKYLDTNTPFGLSLAQFNLDQFSRMMAPMHIGDSGFSFIVERSGMLIATSTLTPVLDENMTRVNTLGSNCNHSGISEAMRAVNKYGNLSAINSTVSLSFTAGKRYFLSVAPFVIEPDINWLLLIAYPREDMMAQIDKNTKLSISLVVVFFVLAVVLSLGASAVITRPLHRVSLCLNSISCLDMDKAKEWGRSRSVFSELNSLGDSTDVMISSLCSFQKFVPVSVVKSLVESKQEAKLGVELSRCVIFFSDIENFTGHSETMKIADLVLQHTEYMDAMTAILERFEATIDKFIGDGIMAFWNAPQQVVDFEKKACLAAYECKQMLCRMREFWSSRGAPPFFTRMGLHKGEVYAGNMGSTSRFNYTVLGEAVNIAARMEPLNKVYGTEIIISETVWECVKADFLARPLGLVQVKGKKNTVRVFELICPLQVAADLEIQQVELFAKALSLVEEKQFQEAVPLLNEYQQYRPGDLYTLELLNLCDNMMNNSKVEWELVRVMHATQDSVLGRVSETNSY